MSPIAPTAPFPPPPVYPWEELKDMGKEDDKIPQALPVAVTKRVVNHTTGHTIETTNYRVRNRAEMKMHLEDTARRTGEMPMVWLGRLIMEHGQETVDRIESRELLRHSKWSLGLTTSELVENTPVWPISLCAMATLAIGNSLQSIAMSPGSITSGTELVYACAGLSYITWRPQPGQFGLNQQQVQYPHPFIFILDPTQIPVMLFGVTGAKGGLRKPQPEVVLRLRANQGQPISTLYDTRNQVSVAMNRTAKSDKDMEKGQGRKPQEPTKYQRAFFGFLLKQGVDRKQLERMSCTAQEKLAEEKGWVKWGGN